MYIEFAFSAAKKTFWVLVAKHETMTQDNDKIMIKDNDTRLWHKTMTQDHDTRPWHNIMTTDHDLRSRQDHDIRSRHKTKTQDQDTRQSAKISEYTSSRAYFVQSKSLIQRELSRYWKDWWYYVESGETFTHSLLPIKIRMNRTDPDPTLY